MTSECRIEDATIMLVCSAGGIPYNKAALDAKDDEIAHLRQERDELKLSREAWRLEADHERTRFLAAREALAAAESREVCTVAHGGDVTTCGYCQRDSALHRLDNGKALLDALCGQQHTSEMSDEDRETGDYEGAYDIFVAKVRELRGKLYP